MLFYVSYKEVAIICYFKFVSVVHKSGWTAQLGTFKYNSGMNKIILLEKCFDDTEAFF